MSQMRRHVLALAKFWVSKTVNIDRADSISTWPIGAQWRNLFPSQIIENQLRDHVYWQEKIQDELKVMREAA